MSLENVTDGVYLVWLSLAACGLHQLTDVDLPNLRVLDLSDNHLTTLYTNSVLQLSNLVELGLRGNGLTQIVKPASNLSHPSLQALDVSMNTLTFSSLSTLSAFASIRTLNYSFNYVAILKTAVFESLQNLSVLDIRGVKANVYDLDVFHTLPELRSAIADDFRLCCSELFHSSFLSSGVCHAPPSPLSTCADLLGTVSHRMVLWLAAGLCCAGNVALLCRRVLHRGSLQASGLRALLTNLHLADLLMGGYLVLVGVADMLYRGRYVLMDAAWRYSGACKTAGALFLLSCEASLLLCLVIVVERCLTLFAADSRRYRVSFAAAVVLSSVAWAVALTIVGVTVLSVTSHWESLSSNGLCFLLPVTAEERSPHDGHAFHVRSIFNLLLCAVMAVAQFTVFWRLRPGSVITMTSQLSDDVDRTRRVNGAMMTKMATHLTTAVLGLAGKAVPSLAQTEINVIAQIAIAPLSAALGPCMLGLSVWLEKRRKRKEAQLLVKLHKGMMGNAYGRNQHPN
jgi:hypothetical protein